MNKYREIDTHVEAIYCTYYGKEQWLISFADREKNFTSVERKEDLSLLKVKSQNGKYGST